MDWITEKQSLMRTCRKILLDEKPCNLPIGGSASYCLLHSYDSKPVRDVGIIEQYIRDNKRPYLDLSDLSIKGVHFGPDIWPDRIPIRFQGSRLDDCQFRPGKLYDADFTFCTLTQTSFVECTFYGTTLRIHSNIRSQQPVFDQCTFDLTSTPAKGSAMLTLAGCNIDVPHNFFSRCIAKTHYFMMDDAILTGDRLRIHITNRKDAINTSTDISIVGAQTISLSAMDFRGVFWLTQYLWDNYYATLYLTGLDFATMASAHFLNVNLTRASFKNSQIESIKFLRPVWPLSGQRPILFDHSRELKTTPHNWHEPLRLYVQLKKNYEISGNMISAGDWFYREMECRLLALSSVRDTTLVGKVRRLSTRFSFLAYRSLSSYGESYLRPAILMLSVLLLSAVVYFFQGFTLGAEAINYKFCACWPPLTWQHFVDFGKSLVFSLAVMGLQTGKSMNASGTVSIISSVVQLLLTAVFLPLFLLALRRRFRR